MSNDKPETTKPLAAMESLYTVREQLDADGIMIGVSRQALDEVLKWIEERHD